MVRERHTEEFKSEAVKLALSGGLPRQAIADDLGIGKSTLNQWIKDYREGQRSFDAGGSQGDDLREELLRLRRENGIAAIRLPQETIQAQHCHSILGVRAQCIGSKPCIPSTKPKWVADISYIPTLEGWVYLAVVMDLYSRCIVGWKMSSRMKQDLALNALHMAIALRTPKAGLVHHSDRGSQYSATQYQMTLK